MMATNRRKLLSGVLAGTGGILANSALANAQAVSIGESNPVPRGDTQDGGQDAIWRLADHMLSTQVQDVPARVLAVTHQQLIDTLGVGLAGRGEEGVSQLLGIAEETGGAGESSVWGTSLRLPAHDAARINAVMVHALEYDDTFGPGYLHPSAITFPAGIAAAELAAKNGRRVSGREFLVAASVAIDIACRVSVAGRPGVDGFATGWHNTALVGYLASAMLAGRLIGLNRRQLVHAAGIACHQAAGNAQAHLDGALAKRLGAGFAASAGLLAARLAARGATGAQNVLEGEKGWFRQYHQGEYSRALLLDDLGINFPALLTSFKPWPSCRGSHTSVDAALQLSVDYALRPEDIAQVELHNGPAEYPFLSTPIDSKRRPQNPVEAQFSIPWAVAVALVKGSVSIADFTDQALGDHDILAMVDRVVPVLDEDLVNPSGGPGQARIIATIKDGRRFSRRVSVAKGDPEAPMSAAEHRAKFDDCVRFSCIASAHGDEILALFQAIDEAEDMAQLGRALLISP